MRARARGDLPDLELACLAVLWEGGDMTVREVRDRLLATRPLAYTTVLTVLDRLVRKGAASRRRAGRAHVFHAEYQKDASLDRAVSKIVATYFGGSRESLLAYLSSGAPPAGVAAPERLARLDESLL
jgi:predicted transcriptional regulator